MRERVHAKGVLRIYENGRLVDEVENLIVDHGLDNLAALLAGAGHRVTELALGDGMADYSTTPPTLTQPTPADTALESEIIRKPVTVSYPSPGTVRFTIQLGTGEGNGSGVVNYTEAGLFLDDGTMFSHLSFYPRTKSSANTLTFEWNVHFRRVS